jgi:chromosome segregation ATPase
MTTDYHNELVDDLVNLSRRLVVAEGNLSSEISMLGDLIQGLLNESVDDLLGRLEELERNLSARDDELAAAIEEVSSNLSMFREDVETKLADINASLQDLDKLASILAQTVLLQASLDRAERDLQDIDDTLDDESAKSTLHTILLVLLLIICIAILIVALFKPPKVPPHTHEEASMQRPSRPESDWEIVESLPED